MRGGQECLLSQLALFMQLEIDPRLELDECPHLASLRAMGSHFRFFSSVHLSLPRMATESITSARLRPNLNVEWLA